MVPGECFIVRKEQFAMLPILSPQNSWRGFKPQATEPLRNRPCEEAARFKAMFDHQGRSTNNLSTGEIMKMNHIQSNSKSNITAFFSRMSRVTITAVAVVSFLLLTSLIGSVTASTPTPTPTPPVPLIHQGSIQVRLATVASGLTAPLELTSPADGSGRLFINQQTGQILILENGSILPTPFLDVSGRMVTLMPDYDERGLLGFAFHPD